MVRHRHLSDESAVSPVISVILMVAIAVVLSAVISTFALTYAENSERTVPQGSFTVVDYRSDCDGNACRPETPYLAVVDTGAAGPTGPNDAGLTIKYHNGDAMLAKNLAVTDDDGDEEPFVQPGSGFQYSVGDEIQAGDRIRIHLDEGDTVRLVWRSTDSGGDDSATLFEYSTPDP